MLSEIEIIEELHRKTVTNISNALRNQMGDIFQCLKSLPRPIDVKITVQFSQNCNTYQAMTRSIGWSLGSFRAKMDDVTAVFGDADECELAFRDGPDTIECAVTDDEEEFTPDKKAEMKRLEERAFANLLDAARELGMDIYYQPGPMDAAFADSKLFQLDTIKCKATCKMMPASMTRNDITEAAEGIGIVLQSNFPWGYKLTQESRKKLEEADFQILPHVNNYLDNLKEAENLVLNDAVFECFQMPAKFLQKN